MGTKEAVRDVNLGERMTGSDLRRWTLHPKGVARRILNNFIKPLIYRSAGLKDVVILALFLFTTFGIQITIYQPCL